MIQQSKPEYSLVWISKITEVPKPEWDALAQPLKTPFLEWDWLDNMEKSGSVGGKIGRAHV